MDNGQSTRTTRRNSSSNESLDGLPHRAPHHTTPHHTTPHQFRQLKAIQEPSRSPPTHTPRQHPATTTPQPAKPANNRRHSALLRQRPRPGPPCSARGTPSRIERHTLPRPRESRVPPRPTPLQRDPQEYLSAACSPRRLRAVVHTAPYARLDLRRIPRHESAEDFHIRRRNRRYTATATATAAPPHPAPTTPPTPHHTTPHHAACRSRLRTSTPADPFQHPCDIPPRQATFKVRARWYTHTFHRSRFDSSPPNLEPTPNGVTIHANRQPQRRQLYRRPRPKPLRPPTVST